jgi:serine/threonine protein kinase
MDVGYIFTIANFTFELVELLGEGAYARAYKAIQSWQTGHFKHRVEMVVKVPSGFVLSQIDHIQRFKREARILGNVDHPNVVKTMGIYDLDDGNLVLLQELVPEAMALPEFLDTLPEAAAHVYLQALYALREIHTGTNPSAVHRDISPTNVLVDPAGNLKIIDFGLAFENPRQTKLLTRTGGVRGTLGCEAPELLRDPSNVDGRADIYALGKCIAAGLQRESPLHVHVHELPEPWRTICTRATKNDRNERYADADEAIAHAMQLFVANGDWLPDLILHLNEMSRPGIAVPQVWPTICRQHFIALPELDVPALLPASRLDPSYFEPRFAVAFLDKLENSKAIERVESRQIGYGDADEVADLYLALYPALDDASRKEICFRRIARTAVAMHRYHAMGVVREVFRLEKNQVMTSKLCQILMEEDADGVIYGRGVIPGRD